MESLSSQGLRIFPKTNVNWENPRAHPKKNIWAKPQIAFLFEVKYVGGGRVDTHALNNELQIKLKKVKFLKP